MNIEQEINQYFSLFGWNNLESSNNRLLSVLPPNWNNLNKDIQDKYINYVNSPEYTLKKLKKII